MPLPPKAKAPGAIGASEKVPGFVFAVRKGTTEYVQLVASAKLAKQLIDGTGSRGDGSTAGDACFTEDQPGSRFGFGRGGDEGEAAPPSWRPNLQPALTMNTSVQRGQRPTVTAVHSERIAEELGRTTLEVVDAWVDPSTRGARVIARSSVPLELVSTMLGGSKLYAARESQSVHLVLVASKDRKRTNNDSLSAIADNAAFNSSCDHIRVTLKAEKGQGQTATFNSTVELPSLEPKEGAEPKPEAKPDSFGGFRVKTPARAEARVRPIHVHASVTWSSREKEPLLSVSAGWDSRERTAVVF